MAPFRTLSWMVKMLQLFSFDVALGAVVLYFFIGNTLGLQTKYTVASALFVAICIIYWSDHLIDLRKSTKSARRQSHRKYRSAFLLLLVIAFFIEFIHLFYLPKSTLRNGVILGLITILYLVLNQRIKGFKEIMVALGFSVGVYLPYLHLIQLNNVVILILLLFLVAVLNLLIFSIYERDEDLEDGFTSFVIQYGDELTRKLIFGITGISYILNLIFMNSIQIELLIFHVLATTILLLLLIFPKQFSKRVSYRLIGDGVFFLAPTFLFMVNDFDRVARSYDTLKKMVFGDQLRNASNYWISEIPTHSKVLILGGGTGEILEDFSPNIQVHYLEKSAKMIQIARKRESKADLKFIHQDFLDWQQEEKYDFIICPFFLDVFSERNLKEAIGRLTDLSHSKSKLIVTDFQCSGKLFGKLLIWFMHFFFRISVELESRSLKPISKYLEDNFDLRSSKQFYFEMVFSNVYAKK